MPTNNCGNSSAMLIAINVKKVFFSDFKFPLRS